MADIKQLKSSTPYRVTLVGLLVAALGIAILYVAGGKMPVVPPGLVLLLIAAALLVWAPWRWTPIVAIVISLFEAIGVFSTSADLLFSFDPASHTIATWVRVIGIVLGLVGGIVATKLAFRKSGSPAPAS